MLLTLKNNSSREGDFENYAEHHIDDDHEDRGIDQVSHKPDPQPPVDGQQENGRGGDEAQELNRQYEEYEQGCHDEQIDEFGAFHALPDRSGASDVFFLSENPIQDLKHSQAYEDHG